MPKDIAKILDTRNLKAVRLKFDVRAEHNWEPPVKEPKVYVAPVKRYDDLAPDAGWMK